MNGVVANKELASKFLLIALKFNDLEGFITGMYPLQLQDGYGGMMYSASHVMEALFQYYENAEDKIEFSKKVENSFINVLNSTYNVSHILNLLENIEYYLKIKAIKQNIFELDCIKIFDCLKDNINRNKMLYAESSKNEKYNDWKKISIHNDRVSEYGFKFL